MRPLSYPETDVFFLAFSLVDDYSLTSVRNKWIPEIRHYMDDIPIVLVGTKLDLRDDPIFRKDLLIKIKTLPISYEQGELMARKMGCITYIETSSLKGVGFSDMAQVIIKASWLKAIKESPNTSVGKTQKKKCCLQ